jgi:hypothetical protein
MNYYLVKWAVCKQLRTVSYIEQFPFIITPKTGSGNSFLIVGYEYTQKRKTDQLGRDSIQREGFSARVWENPCIGTGKKG